jgi:hypothetical protein
VQVTVKVHVPLSQVIPTRYRKVHENEIVNYGAQPGVLNFQFNVFINGSEQTSYTVLVFFYVIVVISKDQMNVVAHQPVPEFSDLVEPPKRPIPQVKQYVILPHEFVDVFNNRSVHVLQRFKLS